MSFFVTMTLEELIIFQRYNIKGYDLDSAQKEAISDTFPDQVDQTVTRDE